MKGSGGQKENMPTHLSGQLLSEEGRVKEAMERGREEDSELDRRQPPSDRAQWPALEEAQGRQDLDARSS